MATHDSIVTPFRPEQSVDQTELLHAMHTSIEAAFDETWASTRHSSLDTPEELAERYERALAREHTFADKVFAATTEIATRTSKPVTLLLDVDDTFVKKIYNEDGSMSDLVRPAFAPLINALDKALGDNLSIGLLTTRGQSHLDTELQSPTFLAAAKDKIDPNFVLSAREGSPATKNFSSFIYESHEGARENLGDFLNPKLILFDEFATLDAIAEVTRSRVSWSSTKLPILKKLVDTNPDRAFVYVDDAASASVINPQYSRNLAAVQVYDDAAFWSLS